MRKDSGPCFPILCKIKSFHLQAPTQGVGLGGRWSWSFGGFFCSFVFLKKTKQTDVESETPTHGSVAWQDSCQGIELKRYNREGMIEEWSQSSE